MSFRGHVRRLSHRRGANFSLGFRRLPAAKRHAVYAAYAVCRVPDDIVDEAPPDETAAVTRSRLDAWAREVEETYRGRPSTPVTEALAAVLPRFAIPEEAFLGLVEGCRMDLERSRYETFAELERYCELVAVTISDISLSIFGMRDRRAPALGRHLAMALQLTNICRDVGEDLQRGRVYLPLDELAAHGVTVDELERGAVDTGRYRALMRFQCARARAHFAAANDLPGCLESDARWAVRVMGSVYRRVLDRVARQPVRAFSRKAELPRWERWWTVARASLGAPFVGGEV